MNRARDRESAYLAIAAGLSNGHSAASVEAGRRVEQLARTGLARAAGPEPEHEPQRVRSRPDPGGPRRLIPLAAPGMQRQSCGLSGVTMPR